MSFVYILSNKDNNVLYTGMTSNLQQRLLQHRNHYFAGFTARYEVTKLVYFEEFTDIRHAIAREKQIKSWSRARKIALISQHNPSWQDIIPPDELF